MTPLIDLIMPHVPAPPTSNVTVSSLYCKPLRWHAPPLFVSSPARVYSGLEIPSTPQPQCAFLEPIEKCTVVVKDYAGVVIQKLLCAEWDEEPEEGLVRVVMDVLARGLIGYMAGEFGNDVHGQEYVHFSELDCSVLMG